MDSRVFDTGFGVCKQTSVAADFAVWRRAPPLALPWADVTLEFTFVSMPTSSTVTVSTVTLAVAWKQIRMHMMSSPLSLLHFKHISKLTPSHLFEYLDFSILKGQMLKNAHLYDNKI